MDRRRLVVFLLAGVLLGAGCIGGPGDATDRSPLSGGEESVTATVTEVVDGDTIDVRYEDGTTDTVRLLGIDTPEVHTAVSPDEFEGVPDTAAGRECLRDWGERASVYTRQELAGETVQLEFDDAADRRGLYDRLLTYVVLDGQNVNYALVADGHARVFDSRFSQSERFYDAEADAQAAGTGVWECRSISTPTPAQPGGDSDLVVAEIQADAPGNDNRNLDSEYVTVRNEGNEPIDLTGWTVEDDAAHTYRFPIGFALVPGGEVRLYTGSGSDTAGELYWERGGAVWNNDGDTIFIYDETDSLAVRRSYTGRRSD